MDAPGLTKIGKEYAAELINQNKYEYILMGENFKSKFLVNDYETVDNFSTMTELVKLSVHMYYINIICPKNTHMAIRYRFSYLS